MAGAASYWPPQTGQVAVVFPFGTTTATAMALVVKAGGRFISSTQLDNVVVAYAADSQFAARVHDTGALFLLAGRGLCGPPNQQDSQ